MPGQPVGNFPGPRAAAELQVLQTPRQRLGGRVDTQSDNVQQMLLPGHGYFHAADELQASPGGGRCLLQAGGRVVVGHGELADPRVRRGADQIRRRERTVGCRRVGVEVPDDRHWRTGNSAADRPQLSSSRPVSTTKP